MSIAVPTLQGVSRESLASAQERFDSRLASGEVDAATLAEDLFALVGLLDHQRALRRALADPSSSPDGKAEVVRSLLAERVGASALDMLDYAVRLRWARSRDLADALETLGVLAEVIRAESAGHLDDLEDELFRFGRIVDGQPQLRIVLSDPAVPAERKERLLGELLEGKAQPATVRLITEVATHPRGRAFARGLSVYSRIAAQRRELLIALVRTATPLDSETQRRLADGLTTAYGHEVRLNVEIDPELVGGLSVQLGDEVIDGTIAGRLDQVRRRLAR